MLESSHIWAPEADKVDFLLSFHGILGETQWPRLLNKNKVTQLTAARG